MKKFIIAMLCVAVLFGFAACDNSSNTPADEETTTGGVTTELANKAADTAITAINDTTNGFKGVVASSNMEDMVGKAIDAITTVTYTKETPNAEFGLAPTTQTIVLKGIDTTANPTDATTSYTVKFNTFEYTYTAESYDANGEVITSVAKINGYLAGSITAAVTKDATTKLVTVYTVTSTSAEYILAETAPISFTVGDDAYDAKTFTAALNLDDDSDAFATTYAKYVEDTDATYQTALGEFVTALIADNSTGGTDLVKKTLAGYGTTAKLTATYSKDNGGSIVYTFTPEADTVIAAEASAKSFTLPAKSTLTVTISGNPEVPAVDAQFTAVKYVINAPSLKVTDTTAPDFDTINVASISGVASGTVTNNAGEIALNTVALTAPTSGSVSATCPVGPQLVEDGSDFVTATVTKTYTEV